MSAKFFKFKISKSLLKKAPHVSKTLQDIPKDLRDIFTPETEEDIFVFEMNIIQFVKREKNREKVMLIQRQFDLPIRPNQDLEKLSILVRIFLLKQEKNQQNGQEDRDPLGGLYT